MTNKSGFSVTKWLIIVAIVGVAGYYTYSLFRKPSAAAVEYRTEEIQRGNIVQSVTANGSLVPVRLVEVGSQISGVITELRADFNSHVKEGDVLAQIDPAAYERAVVQAEAELANAEAARELSKLNFGQAQELFDGRLISRSEYDQARVNLLQADATVKTREANVERAKVDLDRTTIYAPMDGIIISRQVESGQTVAASMNAPTLFVLANDLTKMRIEAAVSEADVGGVADDQTVQFDVDAFPGRKFSGVVNQVRFAPTTNQNVITYTTVVSVENKDMKLRPGMTANARIITSERTGVLKIPNAALRFRPPEGAVVKSNPDAPASMAEPAPVKLMESGPFAGLPEMPWMAGGGFRRPSDAEREAYAKTLTPEQNKKYEEITAQMRTRFAQGGGQGGGGGGGGFGGAPGGGGGFGGGSGGGAGSRSSEPSGPSTATVYVVEADSSSMGQQTTVLTPVTVRLGVSDGSTTELLEGLEEGDVVATGFTTLSAEESAMRNPLNPFSNRNRR